MLPDGVVRREGRGPRPRVSSKSGCLRVLRQSTGRYPYQRHLPSNVMPGLPDMRFFLGWLRSYCWCSRSTSLSRERGPHLYVVESVDVPGSRDQRFVRSGSRRLARQPAIGGIQHGQYAGRLRAVLDLTAPRQQHARA